MRTPVLHPAYTATPLTLTHLQGSSAEKGKEKEARDELPHFTDRNPEAQKGYCLV